MNGQYKLDGHTPVLCEDLLEWADWFETAERIVARTDLDGVKVSTVFLGLDHNILGSRPLLFETMVFGGALAGEMERYSTWQEADEGHTAMVRRVVTGEK